MHGELLTTCPRVGDEDVRRDVPNLPDNVEFAQTIQSSTGLCDYVEFGPMGVSDLANGMQPVVHKPAALAVYGGAHTPTAVMSHDHDVLHLEHIDRELEDG